MRSVRLRSSDNLNEGARSSKSRPESDAPDSPDDSKVALRRLGCGSDGPARRPKCALTVPEGGAEPAGAGAVKLRSGSFQETCERPSCSVHAGRLSELTTSPLTLVSSDIAPSFNGTLVVPPTAIKLSGTSE